MEMSISNRMPTGLVCKHCGQVFGVIFTPITPETTPLVAACTKCANDAMQGKLARNADEWREVLKGL